MIGVVRAREGRKGGKACAWLAHALGIVFIFVVGAFLAQRADRPLVHPGDPYSDANVLIAGQYFAANGFWRTKLLPNHVPGLGWQFPDLYTHYPPLPDIINGVQRRLGLRTLAQFRMSSAAVSCLALGLWYVSVCYLVGPWPALISLIFLGSRRLFLLYGDSVHQFPYGWLTTYGAMLLFVLGVARRGRIRWLLFAGAWLAIFLNAWASFEYIVWVQVFVWGYLIICGERRQWKVAAMMLTAPLLAFALHMTQNIACLGFSEAVADMGGAFLYRFSSLPAPSHWGPQRPEVGYVFHLRDYAQQLYARSYEWYCLNPAFALLLLAILPALQREDLGEQQRLRFYQRLLLLLGLSGVTWWVAMPQHFMIHGFTTRHAGPFFALLAALVFYFGGKFALNRRISLPVRALVGVALVLWAGQLTGDTLKVMDPQQVSAADLEVAPILQEYMPPDSLGLMMGGGHYLPVLRYYSQRAIYQGPDAATTRSVLAHVCQHYPPDARLAVVIIAARELQSSPEVAQMAKRVARLASGQRHGPDMFYPVDMPLAEFCRYWLGPDQAKGGG